MMARLAEQEETIRSMQEELRVLREGAERADMERATLRATVRSLGAEKKWLSDRLKDEREYLAKMESQMVLSQEELENWLVKNHVVIVCDEKIVRIPYGNEILIVQGDKHDKKKSTLSIISCVKAQKYMEKGCQLFLAHVTMKENEDESKEKRLEDVPTVRDFPEDFPEDLPGLPPTNFGVAQEGKIVRQVLEVRLLAVEGFSKISRPMTKLTQKSVKFDRGEKEETAFQTLKQKLCSAPILALPEGSENFMVYCDASRKGLGAVLIQKEKMWRHYLYGTKCVVLPDHKSLQHILDQKELNMRQCRWLELLSDYD
ncbi:putative reverse transcriptase domain-containing protein, partial [Tanacetum coccineum]